VKLAYRVVGAASETASAEHTAWFLHGILGSGNNWHSFARRLVRRHPGWRAVLVDLRNHGASTGALPPHSLNACAEDLFELSAELGGLPTILLGHSFGGKVALDFAGQAIRLGATGVGGLRHVWVLDASPGSWTPAEQQDADVSVVIDALGRIPQPLARRQEIVDILADAGFSLALSRWMSTNLRRAEDGYRWRFDLAGVREMIDDYFRTDLWSVLEQPHPSVDFDVVRAARSERWTKRELGRFAALPEDDTLALRVLADSGHWVHVDNPDGLHAMLDPCFDRLGG